MKLHSSIGATVALTALFLAACSNDSGSTGGASPQPTVAGALADLGLTTLATAVTAAGLDDDLAGPGPFTLFAPSNAAFAALPAGELDRLLLPQNRAELTAVLTYHVVAAKVEAATARTLTEATSLQGGRMIVDTVGDALFVNDAQVTGADKAASNGVIHVVDRVLLPPQSIVATLQARGFGTLVTAVSAADLVTTLQGPGPFTVLAPTNAAFAALGQATLDSLVLPQNRAQLARILTYHVVPGAVAAGDALTTQLAATVQGQRVLFGRSGTGVNVNGTAIRAVNVPCTNGVVHVLDGVLAVPPSIAQIATDGGFSTLVAALDAAGLTATFADPAAGPFTVFAPTNAAFAALPPGLLNQLLQPINRPVLTAILRYHVAPAARTAHDVLAAAGQGVATLQGASIPVTATVGGPLLDGFRVVGADIVASNGVVHAIDGVLVPPGVLAGLQ